MLCNIVLVNSVLLNTVLLNKVVLYIVLLNTVLLKIVLLNGVRLITVPLTIAVIFCADNTVLNIIVLFFRADTSSPALISPVNSASPYCIKYVESWNNKL